jgi:hypothetical protein
MKLGFFRKECLDKGIESLKQECGLQPCFYWTRIFRWQGFLGVDCVESKRRRVGWRWDGSCRKYLFWSINHNFAFTEGNFFLVFKPALTRQASTSDASVWLSVSDTFWISVWSCLVEKFRREKSVNSTQFRRNFWNNCCQIFRKIDPNFGRTS